jgi:hypothetical protein
MKEFVKKNKIIIIAAAAGAVIAGIVITKYLKQEPTKAIGDLTGLSLEQIETLENLPI